MHENDTQNYFLDLITLAISLSMMKNFI